MTLLESFVRDEVFIDFGADMIYGSDQYFDGHPSCFPTVGFKLIDTNGLSRIADRIRKDLGFTPMHSLDEYTEELCDFNGWYDFFVWINGYTATHMDNCIEFIVVNSDSPDDEEHYTIDLTEEEQKILFACLDSQCREQLGKSCEDLLTEAEKRMENYCSMEEQRKEEKVRQAIIWLSDHYSEDESQEHRESPEPSVKQLEHSESPERRVSLEPSESPEPSEVPEHSVKQLAYQESIDALKKQIPMKAGLDERGVMGIWINPCGNCGEEIRTLWEYCPWCGQRILRGSRRKEDIL